jgi:acyl-CoA thioesterase FadM
MNLFMRFLLLLWNIRKQEVAGFQSISALNFRVLPTDSDYFQHHLTNSRFPSFMDLGRIDWLAKAGLYKPMRKNGWGIVVSSNQITYLGLIRWGKPFTVQTQAVYWDKKYLYLEHRFISAGSLRAVGIAKLVFSSNRGSMPLADMLAEAGIELAAIECPENIKDLQQALSHKY